MNNAQQTAIAEFAEHWFFDAEQLTAFIKHVTSLADMPHVAVSAEPSNVALSAVPRETKQQGKAMSDDAIKIREYIMACKINNDGRLFTARQMAEHAQVAPPHANNALTEFEAKGIVERVGYQERTAGQRGKNVQLWKFT